MQASKQATQVKCMKHEARSMKRNATTQMNEIALTRKALYRMSIDRGGVSECVGCLGHNTQAAKDKSVCMLVGRLGI